MPELEEEEERGRSEEEGEKEEGGRGEGERGGGEWKAYPGDTNLGIIHT